MDSSSDKRGVGVGVAGVVATGAGLILWSLILCILSTLARFGCKLLNFRPIESNLHTKSLNDAQAWLKYVRTCNICTQSTS